MEETIKIRAYEITDAPKVPDDAEWHRRMAARKSLVAEEDNEVAGFAELEEDGHLDTFYLRKNAVEDEARTRDFGRIFTEASITARPFFGRQGFRVLREQTVRRRGVGLTNFVMEKPLDP